MFTKWLVAVVITLSGLLSQGQDLKAITRHYKPNDTLRYRNLMWLISGSTSKGTWHQTNRDCRAILQSHTR